MLNISNNSRISQPLPKLVNQVIAHYNQGNFEQALVLGNDIINAYPFNHLVHNILGAVNSILGHKDEAVHHLRQAIKLRPNHYHAYYNLGLALKSLCKHDEARKMIEKAIQLKPDFATAHKNLGDILREQNLNDLAVKQYKIAVQINPKYFEAYNDLGETLQELTRYEEANIYFQNCLKINPAFDEGYRKLAECLTETGSLTQAKQILNKISILKPKDTKILFTRAILAQSEGNYIDAIKLFETVNDLEPKNSAALAALVHYSSYEKIQRPVDLFKNFSNSFENPNSKQLENLREDKQPITALIGFGRSGSLFLHSLIDGHPEVATLPGYFFKGWFGVESWEILEPDTSKSNWRENLAELICFHYEPQFNAYSKRNVFGKPNTETAWLADNLGFTRMGTSRSEVMQLDVDKFKKEFVDLLSFHEKINQSTCFEIINHAFDKAYRENTPIEKNNKRIFYHIHNPNYLEHANFLRQYPQAKILYIIRNPIQMLESWLCLHPFYSFYKTREKFDAKDFHQVQQFLFASSQLFFNTINCLYSPLNSLANTKGVKLEDIKRTPNKTIPRVANWMGIKDHPCLYKSEFLGRQYSRPSMNFDNITGFDTRSIDVSPGRFFGEKDIQILETLFWPLLSLYKYTDLSQKGFEKNLEKIKPWLDEPFQFEKDLDSLLPKSHGTIGGFDAHKALHRQLINAWETLSTHGTYPHMIKPL